MLEQVMKEGENELVEFAGKSVTVSPHARLTHALNVRCGERVDWTRVIAWKQESAKNPKKHERWIIEKNKDSHSVRLVSGLSSDNEKYCLTGDVGMHCIVILPWVEDLPSQEWRMVGSRLFCRMDAPGKKESLDSKWMCLSLDGDDMILLKIRPFDPHNQRQIFQISACNGSDGIMGGIVSSIWGAIQSGEDNMAARNKLYPNWRNLKPMHTIKLKESGQLLEIDEDNLHSRNCGIFLSSNRRVGEMCQEWHVDSQKKQILNRATGQSFFVQGGKVTVRIMGKPTQLFHFDLKTGVIRCEKTSGEVLGFVQASEQNDLNVAANEREASSFTLEETTLPTTEEEKKPNQ